MSQALTLARPYARAAFSLARDGGRAAAVVAGARFRRPRRGRPAGAARCSATRACRPADAVGLLRRWTARMRRSRASWRVLADNRRLPLLPEIAGLFEQLRAEAERVVKAHDHLRQRTAGVPSSTASRAALKQALRPRGRGRDGGRCSR